MVIEQYKKYILNINYLTHTDNETWHKFNEIDLKQFYRKTSPPYYLFACELEVCFIYFHLFAQVLILRLRIKLLFYIVNRLW